MTVNQPAKQPTNHQQQQINIRQHRQRGDLKVASPCSGSLKDCWLSRELCQIVAFVRSKAMIQGVFH